MRRTNIASVCCAIAVYQVKRLWCSHHGKDSFSVDFSSWMGGVYQCQCVQD